MIACYPLPDIWPVIRPKIQQIRQAGGELLDWTLDDIYRALEERQVVLFNNDEDNSFAICKVNTRNKRKILFIWIAYGENGKRERNLAFLKEIALSVGATTLEMESPRRGFERMPGWKPCMTTYQMEV